ncbi:MAG: FHA domain protein [Chloroflexi bacterium ADurb.Bin360]|nr:MAG: FHA domain protein [Chloroflexi bacterium ADurb.Bin360]
MDFVIITLQLPQLQRAMDLELPGEIPLVRLLPALVQATGSPVADNARRPLRYQLFVLRQGQPHPLREQDSLAHAGVMTGDVLLLTGGGAGVVLPPPVYNNSALLQCPSGAVIALDNFGKSELLLGRFDASTGKHPDVELSEEPDGNTVSRMHVLLRRQGAAWYIVPLAEQNITELQKKRLPVHEPCLLQDSDELLLGKLRLVFRAASS